MGCCYRCRSGLHVLAKPRKRTSIYERGSIEMEFGQGGEKITRNRSERDNPLVSFPPSFVCGFGAGDSGCPRETVPIRCRGGRVFCECVVSCGLRRRAPWQMRNNVGPTTGTGSIQVQRIRNPDGVGFSKVTISKEEKNVKTRFE